MDDLISRQAAIEYLIDALYDLNETDYVDNTFIEKELKKVPPVHSEPKTGQWIDTREQYGEFEFMCSNCELLCCTNHYNYCPNCGAKLESE